MRLIRDAILKSEDESGPSSVQSTDNYGIYDSACSDLSDCECVEDRKLFGRYKSPFCSLSVSYSGSLTSRGNMDRLERTPLLSAPVVSVYKTVSNCDSLGPGEISGRDIIETFKRLEKKEKPERRKQSSLVTIFSVWNTIMGSSLLTMAWGVGRAGLPTALLLVAFMAALCLYTAHLLLKVNKHHGGDTCEVPALCRTLLGPWAEAVAHVFSLLVLLGANIVYWLLIANFLFHTVNYVIDYSSSNTTHYSTDLLCPKKDAMLESLSDSQSAPSPYWGLHTTVPFYVAIGVYPLLNFSNVTFFTKFNSLGTLSVAYLLVFVVWKLPYRADKEQPVTVALCAGTLSVAYLLVFVVWKGTAWGVHAGTLRGAGPGAAALSGILALSFYIHNIIITIMSHNEKQDNNGRDLTIAFLLVTVTYTLVGAVFYICFPLDKSCIEDNILNNFEMHDVMTAVARVLLLFQVVTVYPLVAFMLRSEAILLLPFRESRCLTLGINVIIVALCVLVACVCPNIGTIIRYTGAVSGLVHIFALPSMLQVRSLQLRGKLTFWKASLYLSIVLFGIVNLLMQFFISE